MKKSAAIPAMEMTPREWREARRVLEGASRERSERLALGSAARIDEGEVSEGESVVLTPILTDAARKQLAIRWAKALESTDRLRAQILERRKRDDQVANRAGPDQQPPHQPGGRILEISL